MESLYTLILSVRNCKLEHCVSALNLQIIIQKIYPAKGNLKICQFLLLDAIKNWNVATLSTINQRQTSIYCLPLEKNPVSKTDDENETVDLQIKLQRSGLLSWITLKVRTFRLSVSERNIKLKTKQYILAYNWSCNTITKNLKKREDLPSLWFHLFWIH